MRITIDTQEFVKFLSKEEHFTKKQAEKLVEAAKRYHNSYVDKVATKDDIHLVRKEMKEMELRMTIKLGAIMAGGITIYTALVGIMLMTFGFKS